MSEKTIIAVRCRPLFPSEIKKSCDNIIKHSDEDEQILLCGGRKGFEFDRVFHETNNQKEVFDMVQPVIQHVWQGYHATVLAYGQTGTGKTYTMGTKKGNHGSDEADGVVPRSVRALFDLKNKEEDTQILVTFMEVYNEEVYDLLASVPTKLQVKGMKVPNLTKVSVHSESEALMRLDEGIEGRRFCATQANSCSSRSHAIFTLHVCRSSGSRTESQLHLVDLAGSESVRRTHNEGKAFLEGININKGLLALGKVIMALSKEHGHVPFRDSTLTSVLKDSLSRNCYVMIIACISPSSSDMVETINTLRFVQQARKIVNQPRINKMITEYEGKNKNFEEILKNIPPTPANYKLPDATGRCVNGTPYFRRPLSAINFSLPSAKISASFQESPFVTMRKDRELDSPPMTPLSNLSMFEPSRCSSSLSHHNNDQEISILVNSMISEKMEEKMKEFREQTAEMVERKVQERINCIRDTQVAPLTSQLQGCLDQVPPCETLHQASSPVSERVPLTADVTAALPTQETTKSTLQSPAAKCQLFMSPTIEMELEFPSVERRMSSRLKTKRSGECVQHVSPSSQADETLHSVASLEMTQMVESRLDYHNTQDSPRSPTYPEPKPKRRRSVRIEEMSGKLGLGCGSLMSQINKDEKIDKKKKSSRLSLRTYRQHNSSISSTQNISPNMSLFLSDLRPQTSRQSIQGATPSMSNMGQQTSPEFFTQMEKPRRIIPQSRKSMPMSQHFKSMSMSQRRKSVLQGLEDRLVATSPSAGTAQEKHNKIILKLLNNESLRGLQQLPTIGPKTAFIIFNYRKLNGKFKTLEDLHKVPGLPKSYFKRFAQANNIH